VIPKAAGDPLRVVIFFIGPGAGVDHGFDDEQAQKLGGK
jgi:hypothetical protein